MILKSLAILLIIRAAFAVEECSVNGKWINLSHGGMTENLNGVVRCTEDSKLVREVPYVKGKVHGIEKLIDRGLENKTTHTEYRQGVRHGVKKVFNSQSQLESETQYQNDRELGWSRYYYPDGKVRRAVNRAEDDAKSFVLEYNKEGQVREVSCGTQVSMAIGRGTCRYADRSEELRTYFENNKLHEILPFKDGFLHGRAETYNAAGELLRREEFMQGKLHGVSELYRRGKLEHQASFVKGILHGAQKKFHASGSLIEELLWQEGLLRHEKIYYQNGELKSETLREKNQVLSKLYWDNGKLRYIGGSSEKKPPAVLPEMHIFSPGRSTRLWGELVKQGLHQVFYEQGQLQSESTYREDKREGKYKEYWYNGILRIDAEYKNDVLTQQKEYDKSGKLLSDEDYYEDGSRKKKR